MHVAKLRPCIFFGRRALFLLCVGRLGTMFRRLRCDLLLAKDCFCAACYRLRLRQHGIVVWCVVVDARVRVFVFSGVVCKFFRSFYFSFLYFFSCFSLRFLVSL